jgi:hypothetical protein
VSEFFDELERLVERAYERLQTRDPKCSGCLEDDPLALMPDDDGPIICHACWARNRGWKETQGHHVAGRHNDPFKVPYPVNRHRAMNARQNATWPRDTLMNPSKSPLIRYAAWIRGFLDILQDVVAALAPIPVFLERLNRYLVDKLGDEWWRDME